MRSSGRPREVITNRKTKQGIEKAIRRPRRPRHKIRVDIDSESKIQHVRERESELEIEDAVGRRAERGRFMKKEHVGLGSLKIENESNLPGVDIF